MEAASLWSDRGEFSPKPLFFLRSARDDWFKRTAFESYTVVFRGFEENSDMIQINTDICSRKIEELKHCPFSEICWYFPDSSEQFRINGRIEVIDASNPDKTKLQVVHPFDAQAQGELSLAVDDYMIVRQVAGTGWSEGEYKSKAGWFPSAYVEKQEKARASKIVEANLKEQ